MIVSRLKELVAMREREVGHTIQNKDIADETGLTEHTIGRWMKPEPIDRIEAKVLLRLSMWLNCEAGDLLHIEYR